MAAESASNLPPQHTRKPSNNDLIHRPASPISPTSPRQTYQPFPHTSPYDSEGRDHHYASDGERPRRLASHATPITGYPPRRLSHSEYDRPRLNSRESQQRLRDRERGSSRDEYWRDDDRDYYSRRDRDEGRHPDQYGRSRPPRSYRNSDRGISHNKHEIEDTRTDWRDLEKGEVRGSPERFGNGRAWKSDDELSIDGYNYEGAQHRNGKAIDFKSLTPQERAEVLRLPWTQWMHSNIKNHFVASLGEFVGTTMFLFFAFAGTQVANVQSAPTAEAGQGNSTTGGTTGFNVNVYLYIAVCFGFSLMVNVWVFFRISGGLFNPAVTLAMVLVGAVKPARAICLFVAQILGSIAASAMVLGMFPTALNVRTTLSPQTSIVRGVFIEAILTAELVFTIFMLAKEKHKATFIAPVGIGLALFIAELVGVYYTGGSLNPARSFGPCVVTQIFDKEHWIYWVGPMIGALIAVFFYKFIKMLEYEMANPGQDGDDKNDPTKNPIKRMEVAQERTMSNRND